MALRFVLGLVPFALLLPHGAAAQDRPRLINVNIEPYQFPIMSAMSNCLSQALDGKDRGFDDAGFDAASETCRTAILARIDGGEFLRDRQKLTPRQRRDTIRVLDQTAVNLRVSRRYYASHPSTMITVNTISAPVARDVDPDGPIARGVRVLDPVAPQFERYSNCVMQHLRMPPYYTPQTVERAIAACVQLRGQLTAESDAILSRQPDYADPAKRAAAIAEMFDSLDEITRAMGRGEGFLPSPRQATK